MSLHHWRGAKPPEQRRHAARVDSVILPPVYPSLPEALAVLGPRTKDEQGSFLTSLTDQQTNDHHTLGVLGPVTERNQRAPRAPGEAADPA